MVPQDSYNYPEKLPFWPFRWPLWFAIDCKLP